MSQSDSGSDIVYLIISSDALCLINGIKLFLPLPPFPTPLALHWLLSWWLMSPQLFLVSLLLNPSINVDELFICDRNMWTVLGWDLKRQLWILVSTVCNQCFGSGSAGTCIKFAIRIRIRSADPDPAACQLFPRIWICQWTMNDHVLYFFFILSF